MNILLVGGLNVNPERFLPIIKKNKVYGIWESKPRWKTSVRAGGPYKEIQNIQIKDIPKKKVDVVWSLLSPWDGIETTIKIIKKFPSIPVIRQTQGAATPWWHSQEEASNRSKNNSVGNYNFNKLKFVLENSTGLLFNAEKYRQCLIDQGINIASKPYAISNGMAFNPDLINGPPSKKLHEKDGLNHILLAGRARHDLNILLHKNIRIYYYSIHTTNTKNIPEVFHKKYLGDVRMLKSKPISITKILKMKMHTWYKEFSQYDAGIMHIKSVGKKQIDVYKGIDINIPGRINTYLLSGLPPIIESDNSAILDFVNGYDFSVVFSSKEDLHDKLSSIDYMDTLQKNVIKHRHRFSMLYEWNNVVVPFIKNFI